MADGTRFEQLDDAMRKLAESRRAMQVDLRQMSCLAILGAKVDQDLHNGTLLLQWVVCKAHHSQEMLDWHFERGVLRSDDTTPEARKVEVDFARKVFDGMLERDCLSLELAGFSRVIPGYVTKMYFDSCVFVVSSPLYCHGKCVLLDDARKVFD